MSGMALYYASRAIMTTLFAMLLALGGVEWWLAALTGIVIFGLFLWAPRSGRYSVHPELGITALRRDERTQGINDKAARNAFVITMFAVAGLAVYYGSIAPGVVPVAILKGTLVLGALAYFISDFFLRR